MNLIREATGNLVGGAGIAALCLTAGGLAVWLLSRTLRRKGNRTR